MLLIKWILLFVVENVFVEWTGAGISLALNWCVVIHRFKEKYSCLWQQEILLICGVPFFAYNEISSEISVLLGKQTIKTSFLLFKKCFSFLLRKETKSKNTSPLERLVLGLKKIKTKQHIFKPDEEENLVQFEVMANVNRRMVKHLT